MAVVKDSKKFSSGRLDCVRVRFHCKTARNMKTKPSPLAPKMKLAMKIYQDIKKRIETIVNLPAFTDELFPQDIASMLKSRLTSAQKLSHHLQSAPRTD
jgi:hypothetical protein